MTTHLAPGGELARWCQEAFPGTAALVDRVMAAARTADAPVRPYGRVTGEHGAEVSRDGWISARPTGSAPWIRWPPR